VLAVGANLFPDIKQRESLVRLAFIDEGLLTIEKFSRFLSATGPLLRAIGNFEVIYVAVSEVNFVGAKGAFWKRFTEVPIKSWLFDDDDQRIRARPPWKLLANKAEARPGTPQPEDDDSVFLRFGDGYSSCQFHKDGFPAYRALAPEQNMFHTSLF
jgi:hypothetical protein